MAVRKTTTKSKPAKPAETERAFKALMKTDPRKVSFIRTHEDWQAHVGRNGADSPLRGATKKAVKAFGDSLVFGENGGLAGVKYGPLATELTFSQFRGLLGLFGIGLGYFADHDNRYCAERGTCRVEMAATCTSNC